ncbi:MAG: hypothetical protein ACLVL7_11985 [Anaerotruncus massiliensis (ex Togo et al. 2019)]
MNVKKLLALLLAIMLTASPRRLRAEGAGRGKLLPAPEKEPDPNWPVAIGDPHPRKPRAAVSLSPALTEVIFELGAENQLAGVSDFCDYPPARTGCPAAAPPRCPISRRFRTSGPTWSFPPPPSPRRTR